LDNNKSLIIAKEEILILKEQNEMIENRSIARQRDYEKLHEELNKLKITDQQLTNQKKELEFTKQILQTTRHAIERQGRTIVNLRKERDGILDYLMKEGYPDYGAHVITPKPYHVTWFLVNEYWDE